MEILKNTWVVGIITGIISGIFVFFLTKWIMDKKGKVEYYKQVNTANNSVINSMKPYIADKGLPDFIIFEALIASTARIFNVDVKDMLSVSIYCEELIREIISDVYVSNDKKEEYTTMLADYKSNIEKKNATFEVNIFNQQTGKYAEKMRRQMSLYISMLTAILGMVSSFALMYDKDSFVSDIFWYPFNENPILLIPIMVTLLVLLTVLLVMLLEMLKKQKQRHRDEINKEYTEEDVQKKI